MNYEKTLPIKRIVKKLFPFVLNKDFMSKGRRRTNNWEIWNSTRLRVLRDKWPSFRSKTFLTHTVFLWTDMKKTGKRKFSQIVQRKTKHCAKLAMPPYFARHGKSGTSFFNIAILNLSLTITSSFWKTCTFC